MTNNADARIGLCPKASTVGPYLGVPLQELCESDSIFIRGSLAP
jgi:hypothetical protein